MHPLPIRMGHTPTRTVFNHLNRRPNHRLLTKCIPRPFPFLVSFTLCPVVYNPSDLTLAMMPGPPSQHGYMGSGSTPGHGYGSQPQHQFDQTGQIAPPGMKPRVTATLWEDEGSLCFQVEAKGVCVARREGTMRSRPWDEFGG
jgi:hypothetical protein